MENPTTKHTKHTKRVRSRITSAAIAAGIGDPDPIYIGDVALFEQLSDNGVYESR